MDAHPNDTVDRTATMAAKALVDVQEQAVVLSKAIVTNILQEEASVRLLIEVIHRLLSANDTRLTVTLFLQSIFEDHYTQEVTKDFVRRILTDRWVREKLHEVARQLVLDLLADPKTHDAMTTFLRETVEKTLDERSVQRSAGAAVRKSILHAFSFGLL